MYFIFLFLSLSREVRTHPVAYDEVSTFAHGEPLRKHTLAARFDIAETQTGKMNPADCTSESRKPASASRNQRGDAANGHWPNRFARHA
jgi:hypothetical protein